MLLLPPERRRMPVGDAVSYLRGWFSTYDTYFLASTRAGARAGAGAIGARAGAGGATWRPGGTGRGSLRLRQWGASMIYAGQNNGNPEGPVGEHALVHGTKFTPGTYTLAVVKGDVNTSGQSPVEFCKLSQKVAVGGSVTAAGDGTFDAPFDWP